MIDALEPLAEDHGKEAYYRVRTRYNETRHGAHGPVPVRRPAGELLHPSASRFLDAAARLGFPAEPDKNAGAAPGAGLVPGNSVDGVRVNRNEELKRAFEDGLSREGPYLIEVEV